MTISPISDGATRLAQIEVSGWPAHSWSTQPTPSSSSRSIRDLPGEDASVSHLTDREWLPDAGSDSVAIEPSSAAICGRFTITWLPASRSLTILSLKRSPSGSPSAAGTEASIQISGRGCAGLPQIRSANIAAGSVHFCARTPDSIDVTFQRRPMPVSSHARIAPVLRGIDPQW